MRSPDRRVSGPGPAFTLLHAERDVHRLRFGYLRSSSELEKRPVKRIPPECIAVSIS